MELKKTPLYRAYGESHARIVDFGGWAMPVWFDGIIEEHNAVRTRAGLFDVSHMGEIEITGKDSYAFIQMHITNDISRLEPGKAVYSPLCFENGGTVDDILVYMLGVGHYMLVVNASNTRKDMKWITDDSPYSLCNCRYDITISDISDSIAQLALQGPYSEQVLRKLMSFPVSGMKHYRFSSDVDVAGVRCLVSRTGYTGEDGFELYCRSEEAYSLWKAILDAGSEYGVTPAGLGARDLLRLEAGMPLYGHELSEEISPLEAGLDRFVKLDKADFIGQNALSRQKAAGLKRRIAGLKMEGRGVPRNGQEIFIPGSSEDDLFRVGYITSGTHSPIFGTGIGTALVDAAHALPGTPVFIRIRNNLLKAEITSLPFYKRRKGGF